MSDDIAKKVCEALGVDSKNVRKIVLTLELRRPVTVVVERVVGADPIDRVVELLRHNYELVHK